MTQRDGFLSLFRMTALYYAILVYSEFVLRAATIEHFFGIGILYILLFSLPPALLAALVTLLLPRRGARTLTILLSALCALFFCSQIVYHFIFRTYYIAYSVANGSQVTQFWRETLHAVWCRLPILLLLIAPVVLVCIFGRRLKTARIGIRPSVLAILLAAAVQGGAISLLFVTGRAPHSPYDLYFQTMYMQSSVDRLGMFTAMRLDISRTLFGFTPRSEALPEPEIIPADDPAPIPDPEPVPVTYGENRMEIDFSGLAASESDDRIAELHRYFASLPPSRQNEKTGMFAGCNLIEITAESFSYLAVDPVLTPTLYRMMHDGFYFSDFYTPIWGVSTSDGEYVACQGLLPKANTWSFSSSSDNALPLVLGRQLPRLGYSAYAYHNNTYTYYHRDKSHPNMGYTYRALGNGLDVSATWPESDVEMIDLSTGDYLSEEPFHAYYMTVSGHLEYNFSGNMMAYKNRGAVQDLPYSEAARAYLACNIELDRAMELLLQRLEEAGVADNTVIVLSADHYPYGLTNAQQSELSGHTLEENFELYRNALIIYKKGMTPEEITQPCSSLDILPTLSNLFGLEYDSRLLMGRDVFSDTPPLVIFQNRSFITDRVRYNALTGRAEQTSPLPVDVDYISATAKAVADKFTYSARILETDYYRLVLPQRAAEWED